MFRRTKKTDVNRQIKEAWKRVFPLRGKRNIVTAVASFCVAMATAYLKGDGVHSIGDLIIYLVMGYFSLLIVYLLVSWLYASYVLSDESASSYDRMDEIMIIVCLTLIVVSLGLLFAKFVSPLLHHDYPDLGYGERSVIKESPKDILL